MHLFTEYVNPHLGQLLEQINLDKHFVRGEGLYLYDADGTRYLDFIAAYGALPFGFNPPAIWQALQRVAEQGEPSFVQPSSLEAAGELARRLVELAPPGIRYATFTNSGTEAVEAAIKLCRAATGRLGILSADNSFHGKTLGALSATGRPAYQQAFGAPIPGFDQVPYGDVEALTALLAERGEQYAALILEPIQGEGGIVVPPPGYLAAARALCDRYGILLVCDEIQTGLGRTGSLFACTDEGVSPDVLLLAKALGGGIMPIGACLCTEAAMTEEFGLKHSSTFAGNALACRVGLAALDLISGDAGRLLANVRARGEQLLDGLQELAARYPRVVSAVRGRGLMLGVEFGVSRQSHRQSFLGVMAEQEVLTPVISSYLLNVERLRVAPTLNGQDVIRLEPALIVAPEHCEQALAAMERVLAVLDRGQTAEVLRHLISAPAAAADVCVSDAEPAPVVTPGADPDEGRFAFLIHPVNVRNYAEFDTSLAVFSDDDLLRLAQRWNDLVEPFLVAQTRITSATGATAYGEFIGVARTADELLNMPQEQALAEVKAAIDLARSRGARVVGLGAYTSVVSRGGLHVRNMGVPVTTGNSYTVVMAAEAVRKAAAVLGNRLDESAVAVVGATGAIGRGTAILLSEQLSRLLLIGNPARPEQSRRRLLKVAGEICRHLVEQLAAGKRFAPATIGGCLAAMPLLPDPDAPAASFQALAEALEHETDALVITTDLNRTLPSADVVVTATSSIGTLVTPDNVGYGAAVCDLSRPPNVSREIKDARPDVLVIDGGVVALPGRPSLGWNFGFEQGLAYACMAETMLLALEHRYEHTSVGADLPLETILEMRSLGDKHGFELAQLRSFDRPLDAAELQRILKARARVSAAG